MMLECSKCPICNPNLDSNQCLLPGFISVERLQMHMLGHPSDRQVQTYEMMR